VTLCDALTAVVVHDSGMHMCGECFDRWMPIFVKSFCLGQFGAPTTKPILVWSNNRRMLESINAPLAGLVRARPGSSLGKRWWNYEIGRFCFNGDKSAMERSSAYPLMFGKLVV